MASPALGANLGLPHAPGTHSDRTELLDPGQYPQPAHRRGTIEPKRILKNEQPVPVVALEVLDERTVRATIDFDANEQHCYGFRGDAQETDEGTQITVYEGEFIGGPVNASFIPLAGKTRIPPSSSAPANPSTTSSRRSPPS